MTIFPRISILLRSDGHQGMEWILCGVVESSCLQTHNIVPHISWHDLPYHKTMKKYSDFPSMVLFRCSREILDSNMVLQVSTRSLLILWAEVRPPGPLLEESRWLDQLTHQQSQDFSSSRQNPHHQWPPEGWRLWICRSAQRNRSGPICQQIHPHILDGRPHDRTKCPIHGGNKIRRSFQEPQTNPTPSPRKNQTSYLAPLILQLPPSSTAKVQQKPSL